MKNYLYIATITAIILASVGMVTAYPTTNQDALPSFILKTKIAKDSLYKEVFDHSGFNALLQKNVSQEGKVNYAAFKKDRTVLRMYLFALGKYTPNKMWSKQEKLAYWINAYNAMTIDLIIRNQPIGSIKEIDNPWKQSLWKLGGAMYNLDTIEHQILRKMDDPRIHFAINCASFSCPTLLNEAYTAAKIEGQLQSATRRFVNDTQRNTIAPQAITISKIFKWFSKDFKKNQSLIEFLNTYSTIKIQRNANINYMDYNWELNN
jgi:hypothetical protein